ncbi:MAG TPA: cysteine dioxygenase family protein [Mycobacteriales bacterium]|nr:cysteine dioxygenase family protein [Mycobacteriales bacterium]
MASLQTLDATQLVAVLERLADRASQWRSLARFDASGRWWRRLQGNDCADIWLLTWLTGQGTELHDHGGSSGAFLVVQGALTEVRAMPEALETRTTVVTAGKSVAISPTTVHDVYNAGPAAAVSLHAYSPPLSEMSFYAQHPSGLARVRTVSTREDREAAIGRRAPSAVPA